MLKLLQFYPWRGTNGSTKVSKQNLTLKVAWLTGDNVKDQFQSVVLKSIKHLDGDNSAPFLTEETISFLKAPEAFGIVSAHAYIGARGIKRALELGSDVVVCKYNWSIPI